MLQLFLAAADPTEHVVAHPWFHIGHWFVFTNQMFMALLAAALLVLILPRLFKDARGDAPSGARNAFEAILEFLRVEVFRPALKEHTDRFVPLLWSLFFFILFCNLLGQIPVDEIIHLVSGGHIESHVWGTATGSYLTTGALAIMVFFVIHVSGVRQVARSLMDGTYGHHGTHEEHSSNGTRGHEAAHDLDHMRGDALPADVPADLRALGNPTKHYGDDEHIGHHHARPDHGDLHGDDHGHGHKVPPNIAWISAVPLYLWNFAPHPFRPAPGASKVGWLADIPLWAFLLLLELIGAVIKPFALMIRLFANMIAGHIVLASLILLIPVTGGIAAQLGVGLPVTLLSLLIRFLELFVGFLQAYIFTFLATLFIASAIAPEH
jgi:F0F1-type ATP synthase membrane subunit a